MIKPGSTVMLEAGGIKYRGVLKGYQFDSAGLYDQGIMSVEVELSPEIATPRPARLLDPRTERAKNSKSKRTKEPKGEQLMNASYFEVRMPNSEEGVITVTVNELQHLVELGEVTICARHVRSVFMMKMGDYYREKDNAQQKREASSGS